ncbi:HAMP domain-containing histidine kinase [Bradyrhizobium sp. ISRA443]|uniref:sensor histidine kinase n=1 Tax=unclassified Bradyrhizobium TaxID=2631580 RepID=UPI00247AC6D1|nr:MULTISPECIES: ATP-binding protein [unclassified Bradyrhizobium]WGR92561.1 HAMP domain-containing histidine kinase [Bradyrhizobium sp. ISRA435]WGR96985.1 HAMP domain-containing histidine kinase [Bradyrhizobium sp. ISRA436]WGS03872.1 HAMP domain-containing histidine kinase [Bradyrhizobium sp. ISRA437]WGS10756.1 HAMP domain-containing histidine kinase [Bradyrhizobium sp. ISRA443]
MFRFTSLTSRIVFLHIVAVAIAAVFLPILLLWLLNSEIDQLHREAMRDQADVLGEKLAAGRDGNVALNLPESLKDLYSEAYGRYRYDIYDGDGHILFSSHSGSPSKQTSSDKIAGASVIRNVGGETVRIHVAEDLSHRDVITDDIVANFFRRVGWITIPILLLLLATDIVIFRRAVAPLVRASDEAKNIGPARTGIRLPTERIPSEILPLVTAVNQAFDRLEDGFRVQRQFTADAAHQLRTPLAILRTRIETLKADEGTDELHADIESMSRIVSQLLEIAELDTLVLDPGETADLRAVCAEVVGSIAPYALARQKDIALRGTEEPVPVKGNAGMLQRAIFNLAENAIKYTADQTSVDVEVRDDGSVRVRDCGPGIPPGEQSLIFQRFWRGDRRRTDGAGLGLSIVQGVVDDHAATVKVENLPEGGAQFTLSFRLADVAS